MAVISDMTTAMRRGYVNQLFQKALPAFADDSWKQLATVVSSDGEGEYYDWTQLLGEWREWIGPRQYQDFKAMGYSLINRDWEYSIKIKRTVFMDDKSGQVQLAVNNAAQKSGEWQAKMMAELIEAGTGTTYGNCYDGTPFFSDTHDIYEDGSAYDNNLTSTALTAANLKTAIMALLAVKRYDNTNSWGNSTGPHLKLVVPSDLEFTAKDLTFDPVYAAGVPSNNALAGTFEYIVNRYLTAATTWYLFETSGALKPIIMQERMAPTLDADKSDDVTDDNFFEYGYWARMVPGYGFPQKALRAIA